LYRKQYTGSLVVKRAATLYLRDGIPVCGDAGPSPPNLTLEEVALARKHDLLEQITELFWLADAEFAIYREGHDYGATPEEARQLRLHPRRVIYHGIRAAYDVARVWRELGDALDGQAVRIGTEATASLGRYRFTADDQMLVAKLTAGYWTPTNLIADTGALDVDAWRLIYPLCVTAMPQFP